MELSKKGSEVTYNRDVVMNEDRISQLPEALILQILSLVPTKVAITTSVLSKQWQSHWKMMPKLKFNSSLRKLEPEYYRKSLLSHKAPVLQSFYLKVFLHRRSNAVETGILIEIAMTRNLRVLVLKTYYLKESFKVPRSLYKCETLETLKLKLNVVMDVPSSVCLKSLRTLYLHCVEFKDDESFTNLLSGCPNLQDLVMYRKPSCRVKTFNIVVPSLERLTIHNGYRERQYCGYVINAPSLKYLKIMGYKAFESFFIENVPELMEANITNAAHVSEIIDEKLLIVLTSVKRLSLALSPSFMLKFPTGSIFYQLVYLELCTDEYSWWNLLPFMLHSSPKLQALKLIDNICFMTNHVSKGEWSTQPSNVPECLLSHLETFMWKGYKWKHGEEREVAKYILKNTQHLKRATFSSKGISFEDKLVVVNDLKSVVKDTNSCQFQFI